MNYHDFDKETDRRGTNSYKWDIDSGKDIIPMWVADMDFPTAPAITKALQKRVEHGIFGYTLVPDGYYQAVISWFDRRHGWRIGRDWIIYTPGVVPALSAVIKALTRPGDKVMVQSPSYNCFFSSIKNNGCEAVESGLVYKDATYTVDFDDFERKASDPGVKLFLLCNPHNPSGRVWTKEELERMNDICMKHGVRVVADEIHCELVMPGHRYVPFASVSEAALNNSITCNSPSKSFNTAGLQIANIICKDSDMRRKINRAVNDNEVCDVNPFGVDALQAAYNEGEEWLQTLNTYLYDNYLVLKRFFADRLPHLSVCTLEGTYLVWVDIRNTGKNCEDVANELLEKGKVRVNRGTMYSQEYGKGFIRINIACPRSRMLEGLERMAKILQEPERC